MKELSDTLLGEIFSTLESALANINTAVGSIQSTLTKSLLANLEKLSPENLISAVKTLLNLSILQNLISGLVKKLVAVVVALLAVVQGVLQGLLGQMTLSLTDALGGIGKCVNCLTTAVDDLLSGVLGGVLGGLGRRRRYIA